MRVIYVAFGLIAAIFVIGFIIRFIWKYPVAFAGFVTLWVMITFVAYNLLF